MFVGVMIAASASALMQPAMPIRRVAVAVASDVVDVEAVVEALEEKAVDVPFPSLIDGVEIVRESRIERTVEGRGEAWLFKAQVEVSGAAVLMSFDAVREETKKRLKEPGFRPGDVPPWIKRQLVEFALTTAMEDVTKFIFEAHQLEVLEGDQGEDFIKWLEDPLEEAKTYVLGSPYTFHVAFNATLPETPAVDRAGSVDLYYKVTTPMLNRAKNILAAGGKVPELIQTGSSSKKKKSKSSSKKRKR